MDYKAINCDIIWKFAISLIVELLIAKIYCEYCTWENSIWMQIFKIVFSIFFFFFKMKGHKWSYPFNVVNISRNLYRIFIYHCKWIYSIHNKTKDQFQEQGFLFDYQRVFFLFSSPCAAYLFSICCFIYFD